MITSPAVIVFLAVITFWFATSQEHVVLLHHVCVYLSRTTGIKVLVPADRLRIEISQPGLCRNSNFTMRSLNIQSIKDLEHSPQSHQINSKTLSDEKLKPKS